MLVETFFAVVPEEMMDWSFRGALSALLLPARKLVNCVFFLKSNLVWYFPLMTLAEIVARIELSFLTASSHFARSRKYFYWTNWVRLELNYLPFSIKRPRDALRFSTMFLLVTTVESRSMPAWVALLLFRVAFMLSLTLRICSI